MFLLLTLSKPQLKRNEGREEGKVISGYLCSVVVFGASLPMWKPIDHLWQVFLIEIQESSLVGLSLLPWETMPTAPPIQLQQILRGSHTCKHQCSSLILTPRPTVSLPDPLSYHILSTFERWFTQCVYKLPFSGISVPFLSPAVCLLTQDLTCRGLPVDGKCIQSHRHKDTQTQTHTDTRMHIHTTFKLEGLKSPKKSSESYQLSR